LGIGSVITFGRRNYGIRRSDGMKGREERYVIIQRDAELFVVKK
jgi:hypothetical protein